LPVALSGRAARFPGEMAWSDGYDFVLQAEEPLVAVVNSDIYSSQRNQEEADLVVGLVWRLYDRGLLDLEHRNERPYSPADFFDRGVGICTPHRAQQAAVLDGLIKFMP
jgi:DNA replication ATP-dependent helicase Dna2